MKTAIVTDSNSGIFPEQGRDLGIFVLPMPVILDGTSYYEGVDLDHRAFYERLKGGADASTSQPAPGDVLDLWERVLDQGYDEIVHIPMSSGLSASVETARSLAADFGGRVKVVDDHRVSVTLMDAVLDAKALVDQGLDGETVRNRLEATGLESVIFLGVDTLAYFKKNGRCTAATAALGTVLNIKPLLKCDGYRFDAVAKIRGTVHCREKLLEAVAQVAGAWKAEGLAYSVGVAGSFSDPDREAAWREEVRAALPGEPLHYEPLSFSVTCHTGPEAFGVGVSRTLRP